MRIINELRDIIKKKIQETIAQGSAEISDSSAPAMMYKVFERAVRTMEQRDLPKGLSLKPAAIPGHAQYSLDGGIYDDHVVDPYAAQMMGPGFNPYAAQMMGPGFNPSAPHMDLRHDHHIFLRPESIARG